MDSSQLKLDFVRVSTMGTHDEAIRPKIKQHIYFTAGGASCGNLISLS